MLLLKLVSIRIGQNDGHGSHFLKLELFQVKFLDVFSVAVSLSIYNWVWVASAVKIADESEVIQTGWNIWKVFLYFKCKIHDKWAARRKLLFSNFFFFKKGYKVSTYPVSSFSDLPFSFFCQKMPKFITICPWKKICPNIWAVFHP